MSTLSRYFKSSIGKKTIMGLTGLVWTGFVFTHMAGNLLIFKGAEAYNKYGHAIVSNPAIYLAETILALAILLHFYFGIKLAIENRRARPSGYAVCPKGDKGASLASKTMAYTGSVMAVFIVLHIATFKYGPHYDATYGGVTIRDLHRLIIEVFHDPRYVAWYVFALILLGFHLSHGFASLFQSLGFHHPKYAKPIKCLSIIYGVVVAAGFISQPVYVYFLGQ